jgi:hypothetical protein
VNISANVLKKFEMTLMLFSGAWGNMIHDKKPIAMYVIFRGLGEYDSWQKTNSNVCYFQGLGGIWFMKKTNSKKSPDAVPLNYCTVPNIQQKPTLIFFSLLRASRVKAGKTPSGTTCPWTNASWRYLAREAPRGRATTGWSVGYSSFYLPKIEGGAERKSNYWMVGRL